MADLHVTPAEVTSASQGIRSAADTLDERVRALTSRVEALLGGGWKGQAAEAFRRDWEQWLHGAKDVVGGLDSMSSLLASTAHSYADQELSNATAVGQSAVGLNMAV